MGVQGTNHTDNCGVTDEIDGRGHDAGLGNERTSVLADRQMEVERLDTVDHELGC